MCGATSEDGGALRTQYNVHRHVRGTTPLLDSIVVSIQACQATFYGVQIAWDPCSIPGRGALLNIRTRVKKFSCQQAHSNWFGPSETLFRLYNHRKGTLKEIDVHKNVSLISVSFISNRRVSMSLSKKPRESKYRHLFGTPFQPTECINGVKIGSVQLDANPVKANGRFLAVPWALTGTVAVIPLSHKGSVHPEHPLILQEDRTVNDLQFASTDDNLLATANSDGTVSFWRIPDGGYEQSPAAPEREYKVSEKRVMNLSFHPLASDVLLTADAAKSVQLWDVSTGQSRASLPDHQAAPTSFCWSADGKLVASSCKDKKVRLFDPRASSPLVASAEDHSGVKGAQNTFVGKQGEPELLLTAGSSKGTDRELALWDPRSFGKRLTTVRVDTGSSHLFPYADRDLGLVYVAGKGDGNIRYYELGSDEPMLHYLNEFKSKDPQTGLALLPKTNVDAVKCEIARFIKVSPNGLATSIRFEVPRRENSFFQDDLFPNTFDRKATTNADGWFSGSDASPHYISLNPEK
ncbi:actin binding protein [Planoprotostelium fungivorum]|uniref:Coronin n=1 Tax=Planoprotostelium fungivorum TaxID=1890364 RepID=A0A2P6NHM2_9EUKA|nr:actin binding protein [Planoprotostelium fungivorum]